MALRPLVQAGVQLLPSPVTYRVVHLPFVFLRKAPAVDAEILSMLEGGSTLAVDATRCGWVRTVARYPSLLKPAAGEQKGWALVDGASVGLGALLAPVEGSA